MIHAGAGAVLLTGADEARVTSSRITFILATATRMRFNGRACRSATTDPAAPCRAPAPCISRRVTTP